MLGRIVQLRRPRGPGAIGSSAAGDPGDRQRDLAELSPTFAKLYAAVGRPSIPPEQLLRALLLPAFYSIRSERQLMERLDFDLLFRWFLGLGIDDPVWDHSTFSKNRDRLLEGDVAAEFLAPLLDRPTVRRLLSSEHFSVDGRLIQAWASMKSFRPKDGDGAAARRRRAQPEPRLPRRAPEQRDPPLDHRSRRAALPQGAGHGGAALLRRPRADGEPARSRGRGRVDPRLGTCRAAGRAGHARPAADRWPGDPRRRHGFDATNFVVELRERQVTPHIAQNTSGRGREPEPTRSRPPLSPTSPGTRSTTGDETGEWWPSPSTRPGPNPRFVVTSLSADAIDARVLYEDVYCARG